MNRKHRDALVSIEHPNVNFTGMQHVWSKRLQHYTKGNKHRKLQQPRDRRRLRRGRNGRSSLTTKNEKQQQQRDRTGTCRGRIERGSTEKKKTAGTKQKDSRRMPKPSIVCAPAMVTDSGGEQGISRACFATSQLLSLSVFAASA